MGRFFSYCDGCKQQRLYITKRKFKTKSTGKEVLTSQSELCRTCYTNIKRMLKSS